MPTQKAKTKSKAKSKTSVKTSTGLTRSLPRLTSPLRAFLAIIVIGGFGAAYLVYSHAAAVTPLAFAYWIGAPGTAEANTDTVISTTNGYALADSTNAVSGLSYSPNGKYIAWDSTPTGPGTDTVSIDLYNTVNKGTMTYPVPGQYQDNYGESKIAWFPGGDKFALVLTNQSKTVNYIAIFNTSDNLVTTYTTTNPITGLTVTGDGKYIVYTTDNGSVYAILSGNGTVKGWDGLPVTMWSLSNALIAGAANPLCFNPIAQPGTADNVAWTCQYSNSSNNQFGVEVDNGTIGPFATNGYTMYSDITNQNITGTSYQINGMAWSPDGTKLALNAKKYVSTIAATSGDCAGTQQSTILTLGANKSGVLTTVEADTPTVIACDGGAGGAPQADIAWSPDGTQIAYLDTNRINTSYAQLYTVASSGAAAPVLIQDYASPTYNANNVSTGQLAW